MARRVLLIHTGGTLMMRGDPAPLLPDVYTHDLLEELPVLRKIADIETRILFNLDSSDMQPCDWVSLARLIHEHQRLYDGFVVVHGTDTMAYSASALSFLLPGLDRPVVLTGAQRPLSEVRTDARTNLVDACLLATLSIAEVGVAFDSMLLRGCRTTKQDAWGMHAFGSPDCAPLAELGLDVHLAPHILPPREPQPFDGRLEPHVLAVRTFPGLRPSFLHQAIDSQVAGLLIEAFGSGNVPRLENSLVPVIAGATERDIPVVIVSQCPRGAVDLGRYEGGMEAARAGAIGAANMTTEAALTKLMIALGRAPDKGRVHFVRQAFAEEWVGERS